MRQSAYAFLTITSIVAAGITGGACSNEILFENDGPSSGTATATGSAGGASGNGGAPGIAAVGPGSTGAFVGSSGDTSPVGPGPTTTVSIGPGPTTMVSTGGGNSLCDTACAHAASCGSDLCQQFSVDCGSVPTQAECPLKCIAVATCTDINKLAMQKFNTPLGACILGCQGSTGSGPPPPPPPPPPTGPGSSSVTTTSVGQTSSSSVGSGGSQFQCQQCVFQSCGVPLQSCLTDNKPGGCAQWGQCIQSCQGSPSCYGDCDAKFPAAAAKYKNVYGCLCKSCDAECGSSINPCSHL